jgi:hypothetical protein
MTGQGLSQQGIHQGLAPGGGTKGMRETKCWKQFQNLQQKFGSCANTKALPSLTFFDAFGLDYCMSVSAVFSLERLAMCPATCHQLVRKVIGGWLLL